jgi:hypothetical protein
MVTPETLYLDSLRGQFDTDAFLSPYSDIVALMVFEHQMHLMNLFTRLGWQARYALSQHVFEQKYLGETINDLADYMLFVDEAPLANPIHGTSGFAKTFTSEGRQDKKGRSLRQLDLKRRLMRYPCSYMIYSEAFDGLPAQARAAVYERIWQILSGRDKRAKYARLYLAPFTVEEISEYVHGVFGSRDTSQELANWLFDKTLGHPFFLTFISRKLLVHGWGLYPGKPVPPLARNSPATRTREILLRFGQVSDREDELLRALAKSSEQEFTPSQFVKQSDYVYFRRLTDKGLLVRTRRGKYKLYHPLFKLFLQASKP